MIEKDKIKFIVDFHKSSIKEVTTEEYQFQRNIESNVWVGWLGNVLKNIEKHESYINKDVYPKLKNFNYTDDLEDQDHFNKLGESILYTEELHKAFLVNYKLFLIERLESFNSQTRFFNSTSLISNCIELWSFEQRREIIKFLKDND